MSEAQKGAVEVLTKLIWAAIGAAAGYYIADRRLANHYEERLEKEIGDAQYFFKEKYDAKLEAALDKVVGSRVSTPNERDPEWEKSIEDDRLEAKRGSIFMSELADVVGEVPENPGEEIPEEVAEALTNYQGISSAPSVLAKELKKAEEKVADIEAITNPGVKDHLLKAMDSSAPGPRLINFTMYDANEKGYEQSEVTYFAKGGVVADVHDEKLSPETVQNHIGGYNLEQLTEDRKTIYVRNDKYRMDFEITLSIGSYDVEVLGKKE